MSADTPGTLAAVAAQSTSSSTGNGLRDQTSHTPQTAFSASTTTLASSPAPPPLVHALKSPLNMPPREAQAVQQHISRMRGARQCLSSASVPMIGGSATTTTASSVSPGSTTGSFTTAASYSLFPPGSRSASGGGSRSSGKSNSGFVMATPSPRTSPITPTTATLTASARLQLKLRVRDADSNDSGGSNSRSGDQSASRSPTSLSESPSKPPASRKLSFGMSSYSVAPPSLVSRWSDAKPLAQTNDKNRRASDFGVGAAAVPARKHTTCSGTTTTTPTAAAAVPPLLPPSKRLTRGHLVPNDPFASLPTSVAAPKQLSGFEQFKAAPPAVQNAAPSATREQMDANTPSRLGSLMTAEPTSMPELRLPEDDGEVMFAPASHVWHHTLDTIVEITSDDGSVSSVSPSPLPRGHFSRGNCGGGRSSTRIAEPCTGNGSEGKLNDGSGAVEKKSGLLSPSLAVSTIRAAQNKILEPVLPATNHRQQTSNSSGSAERGTDTVIKSEATTSKVIGATDSLVQVRPEVDVEKAVTAVENTPLQDSRWAKIAGTTDIERQRLAEMTLAITNSLEHFVARRDLHLDHPPTNNNISLLLTSSKTLPDKQEFSSQEEPAAMQTPTVTLAPDNSQAAPVPLLGKDVRTSTLAKPSLIQVNSERAVTQWPFHRPRDSKAADITTTGETSRADHSESDSESDYEKGDDDYEDDDDGKIESVLAGTYNTVSPYASTAFNTRHAALDSAFSTGGGSNSGKSREITPVQMPLFPLNEDHHRLSHADSSRGDEHAAPPAPGSVAADLIDWRHYRSEALRRLAAAAPSEFATAPGSLMRRSSSVPSLLSEATTAAHLAALSHEPGQYQRSNEWRQSNLALHGPPQRRLSLLQLAEAPPESPALDTIVCNDKESREHWPQNMQDNVDETNKEPSYNYLACQPNLSQWWSPAEQIPANPTASYMPLGADKNASDADDEQESKVNVSRDRRLSSGTSTPNSLLLMPAAVLSCQPLPSLFEDEPDTTNYSHVPSVTMAKSELARDTQQSHGYNTPPLSPSSTDHSRFKLMDDTFSTLLPSVKPNNSNATYPSVEEGVTDPDLFPKPPLQAVHNRAQMTSPSPHHLHPSARLRSPGGAATLTGTNRSSLIDELGSLKPSATRNNGEASLISNRTSRTIIYHISPQHSSESRAQAQGRARRQSKRFSSPSVLPTSPLSALRTLTTKFGADTPPQSPRSPMVSASRSKASQVTALSSLLSASSTAALSLSHPRWSIPLPGLDEQLQTFKQEEPDWPGESAGDQDMTHHDATTDCPLDFDNYNYDEDNSKDYTQDNNVGSNIHSTSGARASYNKQDDQVLSLSKMRQTRNNTAVSASDDLPPSPVVEVRHTTVVETWRRHTVSGAEASSVERPFSLLAISGGDGEKLGVFQHRSMPSGGLAPLISMWEADDEDEGVEGESKPNRWSGCQSVASNTGAVLSEAFAKVSASIRSKQDDAAGEPTRCKSEDKVREIERINEIGRQKENTRKGGSGEKSGSKASCSERMKTRLREKKFVSTSVGSLFCSFLLFLWFQVWWTIVTTASLAILLPVGTIVLAIITLLVTPIVVLAWFLVALLCCVFPFPI